MIASALLIAFVVQIGGAEPLPYTLNQIIRLVEGGVSDRVIIAEATRACVDFRTTSAVEKQLTSRGATAAFVTQLKTVCRKAPRSNSSIASGSAVVEKPTRPHRPTEEIYGGNWDIEIYGGSQPFKYVNAGWTAQLNTAADVSPNRSQIALPSFDKLEFQGGGISLSNRRSGLGIAFDGYILDDAYNGAASLTFRRSLMLGQTRFRFIPGLAVTGMYFDTPVGRVGVAEPDGYLQTPAGEYHQAGDEIRAYSWGYGGSASLALALHPSRSFYLFGEIAYAWQRTTTHWVYEAYSDGETTRLEESGVPDYGTYVMIQGRRLRVGIGL